MKPTAESARRYQFGLMHLLYALTLLGVGGALGRVGLYIAFTAIATWGCIWQGGRTLESARTAILVLGGLIVLPCLSLCLIPATSSAREAARRTECKNHLKQLILGLQIYHDVHGAFPPPYIADAQGKPLHSWRVLILPFIEGGRTYAKYHFNEPWNSPHNSKLAATHSDYLFRCPSIDGLPDYHTNYLMVARSPSNFTLDQVDDSANTIMLIEADRSVHWMEPSDIGVEEAAELLNSQPFTGPGHGHQNFFNTQPRSRHIATVDGAVHRTYGYSDRQTCRDLLSVNNGRNVTIATNEYKGPATQPNIANWIRGGVLVALVLLPFGWVFRKEPSGSITHAAAER